MRFSLVIISLMTTFISAPSLATTLKLSPEIKILLIDGKKVSNTLLKGSNGLELVKGKHQVLFKVEKVVKVGSSDEQLYESSPLIVTFDTGNAKNINIMLPRLATERDGSRFNNEHNYSIVDEKSNALDIKKDILSVQGLVIAANFESEMIAYNQNNNIASLPELVQATSYSVNIMHNTPTTTASAMNVKPTQTTITVNGDNVPEQMLQYWYQQADKATQQRFIEWTRSYKAK